MTKTYGCPQIPELIDYVCDLLQPEDAVLKQIREYSNQRGLPPIQVGLVDALHLEVFTRAFGVKKAVEVGTLGGYSAVSIARGLQPGGKLYTLEVIPLHAEVAKENIARAGFSDSVKILLGDTPQNLASIEREGPFDLVFIDADKINYPVYMDWAFKNLRMGGVVLADNTFAWGKVHLSKFDSSDEELVVTGIRKLNHEMARGGKFRTTILPTGEGLTFGVKIR